MWLTATRFVFVHFYSTWLTRYECYDKLFLTSLILNRLTRWLIPLFLIFFDFFYSYVALCHSWQLRSLHLDFFHLNVTPLMSIVVSLRLKLSLTLLWLNRFAKWHFLVLYFASSLCLVALRCVMSTRLSLTPNIVLHSSDVSSRSISIPSFTLYD